MLYRYKINPFFVVQLSLIKYICFKYVLANDKLNLILTRLIKQLIGINIILY